MTYGQPGEPWQQHPDDEAWRDYDPSKHRRRGFRLTVKQALIGLVLLIVLMIVAAELIGASGTDPDSGAARLDRVHDVRSAAVLVLPSGQLNSVRGGS